MYPSNRESKKLNAIKHNEAYLESKKPKPPKEARSKSESMSRGSRIPLVILAAALASVTHNQ